MAGHRAFGESDPWRLPGRHDAPRGGIAFARVDPPTLGRADPLIVLHGGRPRGGLAMPVAPRSMLRDIAVLAFAAVTACAGATGAMAQSAPDYAAIIAAPDRSDNDRNTDKRRDPVKLLAFTGARPGMKVLDMGAGGGYSTELMARAVAPNGVVYGQNPADLPERPKTRFEARLKTPAGKNIVSLARPFDDPVPADARDLDLITFLFFYHDTTYMQVDRAEMNKKLFAALKPGGM